MYPHKNSQYSALVFIRPGALGDTLLALPTLALARQEWPDADITLVGREDVGRLAMAAGLVDHIGVYGDVSWSKLFLDQSPSAPGQEDTTGELYPVIRGSAVIAWLSDVDGVVERNLRGMGAQNITIAPSHPASLIVEHMAVTLARGIGPLGMKRRLTYAELATSTAHLLAASSRVTEIDRTWQALSTLGRPVVAFHAGSGASVKRWPPQSFARLVETCVAHGSVPLLITGPQDTDITRAVMDACGDAVIRSNLRVARDLSLSQLSGLLQRCTAFVGNDSGVTHLAALSGAPTLALFGPTNPAYWAPLGQRVRVIRSSTRDMADISHGTAWEALSTLLANERE